MIKVENGTISYDGTGKQLAEELAVIIDQMLIKDMGWDEDMIVTFAKSVCFVYGADNKS